MLREIVRIDEEKCNGCGICVPNCHEGALQIIDGKAVLISDLLCDGLGACMGHCPEDAITIEKREAEAYDEVKVIADMVTKTQNVVIAHLKHLKDHNETAYLKQGIQYLYDHKKNIKFNVDEIIAAVEENNLKKQNMEQKLHVAPMHGHGGGGCPGSRTMAFAEPTETLAPSGIQPSQLSHWPIQLHLIHPGASHFIKSDLLIAADCTAFSFGNFHADFLKGRKLVIACPKLDSNKDVYIEKVSRLIDESQVNTITVMIMEVPCCGGLLQIVQAGVSQAKRKVPVKAVTIGIRGDVLAEEWV
jgi:NAD-dependent dihydropyrimidine dehydrogenase PreA subunit